jgi:ferredoxin
VHCGACVPVCPASAIFVLHDVLAENQASIQANGAYFGR